MSHVRYTTCVASRLPNVNASVKSPRLPRIHLRSTTSQTTIMSNPTKWSPKDDEIEEEEEEEDASVCS
jgi:hypothetical protein